jgi:hypothetical protein
MPTTNALNPVEGQHFNTLHPRAYGGKFGRKPVQEQLADEAQSPTEEEEADDANDEPDAVSSPPPAESTTVQVGNNPEGAEEAVSKDHAGNLRGKPKPTLVKSVEEEIPSAPSLLVVFADRADATKFALACDAVGGEMAHTPVAAAANGRYHVAPTGMTAVEIDALQQMIHMGMPLSEMTPPAEVEPLPEGDAAVALEKAAGAPEEPECEPQMSEESNLSKGAKMSNPLLLLKVKESAATGQSTENDGHAVTQGGHENVTNTVGSKEKITEETAKYPKTGHKQKRRPRLVLKQRSANTGPLVKNPPSLQCGQD